MPSIVVYLFQIHYITPLRVAFVALAVLNIALMLILALKTASGWFSFYLPVAAGSSLFIATPPWNEVGEIALLIATIGWAYTLIPRERSGFLLATGIALMLIAAIHMEAPPPWPHYPADQYYTRLYSAAVFFACAWSSFLVPLFERTKIPWEHTLAIPWFGAVLLALVNRGWQYFTIGITAKLIWTACLVGWLALNHLRNRAVSAYVAPKADLSHPRGAFRGDTHGGTSSFLP